MCVGVCAPKFAYVFLGGVEGCWGGNDGSCSCLTISFNVLCVCLRIRVLVSLQPLPSLFCLSPIPLCRRVMWVTLIKSLSLTHANWNVRFTEKCTNTPAQAPTRSHSCHLFGIVVFVAHVRDTCSCFLLSPLHTHPPPLKSLPAWPPKFAHFNTSKLKNKRRLFSAIFFGLGNTQFE